MSMGGHHSSVDAPVPTILRSPGFQSQTQLFSIDKVKSLQYLLLDCEKNKKNEAGLAHLKISLE